MEEIYESKEKELLLEKQNSKDRIFGITFNFEITFKLLGLER